MDLYAGGLLRVRMSTKARRPTPESAQCKIHEHSRGKRFQNIRLRGTKKQCKEKERLNPVEISGSVQRLLKKKKKKSTGELGTVVGSHFVY